MKNFINDLKIRHQFFFALFGGILFAFDFDWRFEHFMALQYARTLGIFSERRFVQKDGILF